ncbi:hypothetical protein ACJX0J_020070, partial [Zea mays]
SNHDISIEKPQYLTLIWYDYLLKFEEKTGNPAVMKMQREGVDLVLWAIKDCLLKFICMTEVSFGTFTIRNGSQVSVVDVFTLHL